MTENDIGTIIVGVSIALHRELGPGLLESVYEIILIHELQQKGLSVQRQVPIPVEYHGIRFEEGFRADLIVEGKVIVELKSVEHVTAAHKKQLQTYLRLTGCKLGYLRDFGEALMKEGITRAVNQPKEWPSAPQRLCARKSWREAGIDPATAQCLIHDYPENRNTV